MPAAIRGCALGIHLTAPALASNTGRPPCGVVRLPRKESRGAIDAVGARQQVVRRDHDPVALCNATSAIDKIGNFTGTCRFLPTLLPNSINAHPA